MGSSVLKKSNTEFVLLVASAESQPTAQVVHEIEVQNVKATLTVQYGDFSKALQRAADALREVSSALDFVRTSTDFK